MSKKDKRHARLLFDALSDPEQRDMFALDSGEIGDVEGFFITAKGRSGKVKPVALVLTPAILNLIHEAVETLFEPDEDDEDADLDDEDDEDLDDEDDDDEPRASRGAGKRTYFPW